MITAKVDATFEELVKVQRAAARCKYDGTKPMTTSGQEVDEMVNKATEAMATLKTFYKGLQKSGVCS